MPYSLRTLPSYREAPVWWRNRPLRELLTPQLLVVAFVLPVVVGWVGGLFVLFGVRNRFSCPFIWLSSHLQFVLVVVARRAFGSASAASVAEVNYQVKYSLTLSGK